MKNNIVRDVDLQKLVHESNANLGSSGYYRLQCPNCTGSSLALSVRSDFKFGYCFRCDTLFLPNKGRLAPDDIDDITLESTSKFVNSINAKFITLIGDPVPKEGIDYLTSRNKFVKDWSKYKQRYEITDEYILILTPYFWDDTLVYYQARYQYTNGDRRFSNPKSTQKSVYLPSGTYDNRKPSIICEGPFDAIALDCIVNSEYNVLALGGCTLSNELKLQLQNFGMSEVLVFLDDEKKTNNLVKELNKILNATLIQGIYSKDLSVDGDDPEEVLNKVGPEIIKGYIDERLY